MGKRLAETQLTKEDLNKSSGEEGNVSIYFSIKIQDQSDN